MASTGSSSVKSCCEYIVYGATPSYSDEVRATCKVDPSEASLFHSAIKANRLREVVELGTKNKNLINYELRERTAEVELQWRGTAKIVVRNRYHFPLRTALCLPDDAIAGWLLDHGADPKIMFGHALCHNRVQIVEKMLQKGANPNVYFSGEVIGESGIAMAAGNGWIPMVKLLLAYGATVSVDDLSRNAGVDVGKKREELEKLSACERVALLCSHLQIPSFPLIRSSL